MNGLHRVRRAIGPKDKDRCYDCYRKKTKCTPRTYNWSDGEKCDKCQIGNYPCSVRRKNAGHEAHQALLASQAHLSRDEAAAGPTSIASEAGYGYLPPAVQTHTNPLNTVQPALLAASQAGHRAGPASEVSTDQYARLANVQQAPLEARPSSTVPTESLHPNPPPPGYRQVDEENEQIKDWFAKWHGCDGLLCYLRSRLEALVMLQPSGPGHNGKLQEEGFIRSAEKQIRLHHKHVLENLSRALSAQASNLRSSFVSSVWKLFASSQRLVDREPTARYVAPLVTETVERVDWEEASQYHKDGYPSLGDQICRGLAIQHQTAILRNPGDQKISRIQTAYSNLSQRMMEVWQDLDPSEDLWPTDGSHDEEMDHVFSDMILVTLDKLAWRVAHPHPHGGLVETVTDFFKRTLLHLACEDPQFDSFDLFDSCSPGFVEAWDKFRMRAVHIAALYGNVAGIKKLRALNADMTVLDHWGRSPLMLASAKGHTKVVELLLTYSCEVDAVGTNQPRALFFAVRAGMSSTVHLLLKNGAFPYFHPELDDQALGCQDPVEEAKRYGHEEIAYIIRGHIVASQTKSFDVSQGPETLPGSSLPQDHSSGSNDDALENAGTSAPLSALNTGTGADVGIPETLAEPLTSTRPQPSSKARVPVFDQNNIGDVGWNPHFQFNPFPSSGGIRVPGVQSARNDTKVVHLSRSPPTVQEEGHDDALSRHAEALPETQDSYGLILSQEELESWNTSYFGSPSTWSDPP